MFDCPDCSKRLEIAKQCNGFLELTCSNKKCKFNLKRRIMKCTICGHSMFIIEQEDDVVLFKCGLCTNLEEVHKITSETIKLV